MPSNDEQAITGMVAEKLRMKRSTMPVFVTAVLLAVGLVGCEKQSGEAVVLTKEHIAAALPVGQTPTSQSAPGADEQPRPVADDEITVDGYVMKPGVRGTGHDPRALSHEQWIVKVRMLGNGRTIQVPADQSKWEKLRENDRVKVSYRTGKYTGTVWAAEIE
ncbi:MAG: hypothetical protein DMF01_08245 [Verrucomicrobia bacterium]|nr:MAG: hypothetical protein DMF01_08245 [Verrucomicrobiota bacterium]